MTGTTRRTWLLLPLLLLASAGTARAEDPCAPDLARHCPGKAPVDELSCLQSHRNDLAPACRDRLDHVLVSVQLLIQDCEPDAFELCPNVGRGEPTARCLAGNHGKLTRRCQEDLDGMARIEAASAQACASDAARYCGDVKPGKGEVYICLVYKGKDISDGCRKAMAR
jgi:hypothetical protein